MAGELTRDLDAVLALTEPIWPSLRGKRLFITGGTGFMGKWLLASLAHANRRLEAGITAVVLTRDPAGFRTRHPQLGQDPAFRFVGGDVTAPLPALDGPFHLAIHAATEASAQLNQSDPLRMFDTIVGGTRRVLDWCVDHQVPRLLFLSSGAVYGVQPPDLERVSEGYRGGPDCTDPQGAYAQGKRAAEGLCSLFAQQLGLEIPIARCFAFVGPHLPLDTHFAIGNFIRDAMAGGPIVVKSDGSPVRSYLYASDMAAWLLTLLVQGDSLAPVNVGSGEPVSIRQLAETVATTLGTCPWQVLGVPDPTNRPPRYLGDVTRARERHGLQQTVGLEEAILRTAAWHGWKKGEPR